MSTSAITSSQPHRICNLVPSRGTEKDWKLEHAVASGALGAPVAPPPSVDLRADRSDTTRPFDVRGLGSQHPQTRTGVGDDSR